MFGEHSQAVMSAAGVRCCDTLGQELEHTLVNSDLGCAKKASLKLHPGETQKLESSLYSFCCMADFEARSLLNEKGFTIHRGALSRRR